MMAKLIPRIFILMDPARGYDRALLEGMARYALTHGPVQIIHPPPFWARQPGQPIADLIVRSCAQGIVMVETEDTEALRALKLPMVVSPNTRRQIPDVVNVVTDHAAIGAAGAEHLIQAGFRQFAFCGYSRQFWSEERQIGFVERLRAEGFDANVYQARLATPIEEEADLLEWLRTLPKPAGVMACVDERGRKLIEICTATGLRVPDELGILGVDDDELLCELTPVPLSSISNNGERIGFDAAACLHRMICSPEVSVDEPALMVLPTGCTARQSTDFVNEEDPAFAAAVRYIRDHVCDALRADEVAAAVNMTRRTLERRFATYLGRSIHAEIRRTRIKLFSRLLLDTHWTVAEIATHLNMPDTEHAARYFKAETGMTPREYHIRCGRK